MNRGGDWIFFCLLRSLPLDLIKFSVRICVQIPLAPDESCVFVSVRISGWCMYLFSVVPFQLLIRWHSGVKEVAADKLALYYTHLLDLVSRMPVSLKPVG